jgi:hypothetical protein
MSEKCKGSCCGGCNNSCCCPPFDPTPWDNKVFDWHDKRFIKDKVCTFFYMPLNFGCVIKRLMKKLKDAGVESKDWFCLSDHTSKWNMDIYLAVDKEIPNAETILLSGKFVSKVYEGPYRDICRWMKNFDEYANKQNLKVKKLYKWYTTCPKCAKKYGKNYVVFIAQVE